MKPIRRQRKYFVGVDLGGTKILAAVFDERGKLLSREKKSTKPELGLTGVLQRIEECIHEALAIAALPHTAIAALGIGVPGLVDTKGEIVRIAANLDWHNLRWLNCSASGSTFQSPWSTTCKPARWPSANMAPDAA